MARWTSLILFVSASVFGSVSAQASELDDCLRATDLYQDASSTLSDALWSCGNQDFSVTQAYRNATRDVFNVVLKTRDAAAQSCSQWPDLVSASNALFAVTLDGYRNNPECH